MKIFGISVFTIVLVLVAYFIGAKYPGVATKATSAVKGAM